MALGTFAEYITVPAVQVAKLPPNSPLHVLSPIGCAVLTGWGAARAVAGVETGHRYYRLNQAGKMCLQHMSGLLFGGQGQWVCQQ